MKKYLFGLVAITLALVFSAFTNKKAPFTNYIFKYKASAPANPTQLQLEDRNNWEMKISSPFTACTASTEQQACSFQTAINSAYRTSIGSDLYKPSTAIQIVGKLSVAQDEYVVDKIELVEDNSTVSLAVENVNEP